MKSSFIFMLAVLLVSSAYGDAQLIVCGNQPGEIYFLGVHPTEPIDFGFYFSQDYGETISLGSAHPALSGLLADAQDGTLYGLNPAHQYLSTNGGYNWNIVNGNDMYHTYGSGVIPGEVYRSMYPYTDRLERSDNYGIDYFQCSLEEYPDSLDVGNIALGVDSGEVYLWTEYGTLFYSVDYGERFIFLNDLHSSWGVPIHTAVINGAEPGELFIFQDNPRGVWHVDHYGDSATLIFDLGSSPFPSGVAASNQPGELYLLSMFTLMPPGGMIRIYHTTDYFQTWTIYEHDIPEEGVSNPEISIVPGSINLQVFPNPANASFNISYELNAMQDVRLMMYDILGRQVWQNDIGAQSLGIHRLSFADDQLPSGRYFLLLQSQHGQIGKTITIIK